MTTSMTEYTFRITDPDAPLADVVEAVRERAANSRDGWVSNSDLQLSGVHVAALSRAREAGVLEERFLKRRRQWMYRPAS